MKSYQNHIQRSYDKNPILAASCMGVKSRKFRRVGSAPASSKILVDSFFWANTAQWRAVSPSESCTKAVYTQNIHENLEVQVCIYIYMGVRTYITWTWWKLLLFRHNPIILNSQQPVSLPLWRSDHHPDFTCWTSSATSSRVLEDYVELAHILQHKEINDLCFSLCTILCKVVFCTMPFVWNIRSNSVMLAYAPRGYD